MSSTSVQVDKVWRGSALWLLLVSTPLYCDAPQTVDVFQSSISPTQIQVGERVTVKIRLQVQESASYRNFQTPEILNGETLQVEPWKVLDERFVLSGEQAEWAFDLTAYQIGTFRIPPIEIRFGPNTYSTIATDISVATTRDPQDRLLNPNADAEPAPVPLQWWVTVALMLVGVGVLAYLILRFRKQRERLRAAMPNIPATSVESIDSWLKSRLQQLELSAKQSSEGVPREAIHSLVREYMKRRYQLPTRGYTLRDLGTFLDLSKTSRLATALTEEDRVRFKSKANSQTAPASWLQWIREAWL